MSSPPSSIPGVPDHPPPDWNRRRRLMPHSVSGLIGGLVVAAVAAVLVATGAIGHTTERVTAAAPIASPPGGNGIDARGIYAHDAPGVVHITAHQVSESTPFGQSQGTATGSGLVLDRAGHILTNAHVIDGAARVTVTFEGNGAEVPATVTGRDTSSDLAVLSVDPSKASLHPMPLGNSDGVQVGDPVAAIGNPFGLDRTITTGIVSAKQREIQAPDGFTIRNVIQTDAAINPGNSGGPLFNSQGRVIGINSQIATGGTGSEGNVGIGFAIPINTAKSELSALEHGGALKHAFLGVTSAPSVAGALVQQVEPGSPAADAHLRSGDVITRVDDTAISGPDALVQAIGGRHSGDQVDLTVLRDGRTQSVPVTLGGRPSTVAG
jgi:putative serine protease PepD